MRYGPSFRAGLVEDARRDLRRAFPLLMPILLAILPKLVEWLLDLLARREERSLREGVDPSA